MWQFSADNVVPVDNSRMVMEVLKASGIFFEYKIFPCTIRCVGLGMVVPIDGWLGRAVRLWQTQEQL